MVSLKYLYLAALSIDKKDVLSHPPSITRNAPRVIPLFSSEPSILPTTRSREV